MSPHLHLYCWLSCQTCFCPAFSAGISTHICIYSYPPKRGKNPLSDNINFPCIMPDLCHAPENTVFNFLLYKDKFKVESLTRYWIYWVYSIANQGNAAAVHRRKNEELYINHSERKRFDSLFHKSWYKVQNLRNNVYYRITPHENSLIDFLLIFFHKWWYTY